MSDERELEEVMSASGKRLLAGLREAGAIARGEEPAPRLHMNGHDYVPLAALSTAQERIRVLEVALKQINEECQNTGYQQPVVMLRMIDVIEKTASRALNSTEPT